MLGALTLLRGLFWIALFPVFKIADEASHYENVQYRAEHWQAPHYVGDEPVGTTVHAGSPPEVLLAWKRSNDLFRSRYVEGVRSVHEENELRAMAKIDTNRLGSARLTSAGYPGFYYDACVPVYELFRKSSVLVRVMAVRCVSLAFGILAVVCTFFAGRLLMKSRALAVAAATVVMLQPMESQMTVGVNNDAGVIGLGALLLYLQLRFLVRSPEIPRLRWGLIMALAAGAMMFTKPYGFAMLPGCVVACGWVAARNLRARAAWIFVAVTACCAVVFLVLYVGPIWQHGDTLVPPMPTPTPAPAVPARTDVYPTFTGFLDAISDGFVRYLVKSFTGSFGWLEYGLTDDWLDALALLWKLVTLGAIVATVARVVRGPAPAWFSFRGFVLCAATVLFTVGLLLFAEYRFRLAWGVRVIQGRNMLCGLPPLALAMAVAYGSLVPARFRTLSAAALATSAAALHAGSLFLIFRYHYGT